MIPRTYAWINRKQNGSLGEKLVEKYFIAHGLKILARNYKVPQSRQEIDLIVARADRAYLIEVKNHYWSGSGFESIISQRQLDRLIRLASLWHRQKLHAYRWGICLVHVEGGKVKFLHKVEF